MAATGMAASSSGSLYSEMKLKKMELQDEQRQRERERDEKDEKESIGHQRF